MDNRTPMGGWGSNADIVATERQKYQDMWEVPDYGKHSPGFKLIDQFIEVCKPKPGATLIELGCGSGKAGFKLYDTYKLDVEFLDIVPLDSGALDDKTKNYIVNTPIDSSERIRFIESSLWDDQWVDQDNPRDIGYCVDVMEHIPPEYTMLVINNILRSCRYAFIGLSNIPDGFGVLIGQKLHLTVEPYVWWRDRISIMGDLLDARDLLVSSNFFVKSKYHV